ncbi:MAG: hypothetical protein IIW08_11065 [Clostridia bacterium]|nr:hypothetical protein [Clostridia bacterium]MBQ5771699.1 hypothetical protein [Clostridia bacterium]
MKSLKKIVASLLLIALALSLSACKDKDVKSVIGTWSVNEDGILQMTGLTKEEYDQFAKGGMGQTVTMEFNEEGIVAITMSVAGQYVKDFLSYEVKDGKLIIDGDPADFKIDGKIMTVTQDEIKMTLTKVGE